LKERRQRCQPSHLGKSRVVVRQYVREKKRSASCDISSQRLVHSTADSTAFNGLVIVRALVENLQYVKEELGVKLSQEGLVQSDVPIQHS